MTLEEAIWKTLVLAYTAPDAKVSDDQVAIPPQAAIGALLTCVAHLIAGIPDARKRQNILAQISPALDTAINRTRAQPGIIRACDNGIDLIQ